MRLETVIQRICAIKSCGLYLTDFMTNLKGTVYLHSFVLNRVFFFFLNKYS